MCQGVRGTKCKFCICFWSISCVQTEVSMETHPSWDPEGISRCTQPRAPGCLCTQMDHKLSSIPWHLATFLCTFKASIPRLKSGSASWLRPCMQMETFSNTEKLEIIKHLERKTRTCDYLLSNGYKGIHSSDNTAKIRETSMAGVASRSTEKPKLSWRGPKEQKQWKDS